MADQTQPKPLKLTRAKRDYLRAIINHPQSHFPDRGRAGSAFDMRVREYAAGLLDRDARERREAKKAKKATSSARSIPFELSPDGRTLKHKGEATPLTTQQAAIFGIMIRQLKNGFAEIATASILNELGCPDSRLSDSFRSNPHARKFIESGSKKGFIRLKISE